VNEISHCFIVIVERFGFITEEAESVVAICADVYIKWGERAYKACKKREQDFVKPKGFCGRFEVLLK
jgi:hypothetical protein